MSPSGDGWVNAPAALRPIESDLFLVACTRRKSRVAWAIRVFVLGVILREFGADLRPEIREELESERDELKGRQLGTENYRGEELRVARTVEEATERLRTIWRVFK